MTYVSMPEDQWYAFHLAQSIKNAVEYVQRSMSIGIITNWGRVLFSDKSRFNMHTDNRRIWIWRKPEIRYNPQFAWESIMLAV